MIGMLDKFVAFEGSFETRMKLVSPGRRCEYLRPHHRLLQGRTEQQVSKFRNTEPGAPAN